jgi:hypothetical protein
MPVGFNRIAPMLAVRDLRAALERYGRLGFQTRAYLEHPISTEENPIYGYLTWGAVELHLSAFSALDPQANPSTCYLFVDDADAVHATWRQANVEGRLGELPRATATASSPTSIPTETGSA